MTEREIILPLILQNIKLELVGKNEPLISIDIMIKVKKPLMMKFLHIH